MARSLVATEIGVKRAKEALIDLGITQTVLAEKRLKYSRSTVSNFFNRKPIAHENFTEICKILKLEWRDIAEIAEEEATQDDAQESSATATISKSAKEEFQQIDDKVKQVEKQIRLAFAIAGTVNQVDEAKLNAIVKLLRQITGDASIEIVDIQEGSIKLILTGTPEALVKIQTLYRSGKLKTIKGILVLNIGFENLSGTDLRRIDLSKILVSNVSLKNLEVNNRVNDFIAEILRLSITICLFTIISMLMGLFTFHWLTILSLFILLSLEMFRRLDLRKVDLSGANLSEVDLSGAILWGANLSKADLSGANLWGADLSGTNFKGADISETDLSGANLRRADLRGVNLSRANFRRANLSEADLRGANLSKANLSKANLRATDLSETNLTGANFRNADLREANFNNAIVEFTRFGCNQGISQYMKNDLISRGALFDSPRYIVVSPYPPKSI